MTEPVSLEVFDLKRGNHPDPKKGVCVMEAVAWLAGAAHGDHPECACPVLGAYLRRLNDAMPDKQRQRLRPYLPRLIGSSSPEHRKARAGILVRAAVTKVLPAMYEALRKPEIAAPLRALADDASMATLRDAAREARKQYAAYAADAAAYAADAAAYAAAYAYADAAYADAADADAAAYAADAAAYAAYADAYAAAKKAASRAAKKAARDAASKIWDAAVEALDQALAAGPCGDSEVTPALMARIVAYSELLKNAA